jgi:ubiquinone/menaquinone biosynthesis C-methylase UbiE
MVAPNAESELGANSATQVFSSVASEYARYRPAYPSSLFAWLASQCVRRERVWDCACGSGQASIGLADHFDEVIATDVNSEQIAHASAHPRVRYRVASAEEPGIVSDFCDAITVAQALHWFDVERFYSAAQRVARDGAVLAIWTYLTPILAEPVAQQRFSDFYRDVVGPYWPPERAHVEAGYATLPFPFARLHTPELTCTMRWTLADLLGYVRSWSATVRYRVAHGHGPEELLARSLEPVWGASDVAMEVRFPLRVLATRFHKLATLPRG